MAIPMGQRVPRITRGNSEPALTVARDEVARWRELHVVTALSCTAKRDRCGLPDLIMSVCLPYECMRHLMQERVVNLLVCSSPGIRAGKRDDPRLVVAAPSTCRGM